LGSYGTRILPYEAVFERIRDHTEIFDEEFSMVNGSDNRQKCSVDGRWDLMSRPHAGLDRMDGNLDVKIPLP
jgi:hypothetical protein